MPLLRPLLRAASRKLSGMTEAEWIAGRLVPTRPDMVGTLRFWGHWFGKPYDNAHRLLKCEAEGDLLKFQFNEDETLIVWAPRNAAFVERPYVLGPGEWSPSGRKIKEQVFLIRDADRVRWEWFYYGRPQMAENRHHIEYVRTGTGIETASDTPRTIRTNPTLPALELISLV